MPFKASGEWPSSGELTLVNTRAHPPCLSVLVLIAAKLKGSFAANTISNQKYNVASFLPLVFYEQFKFFFNLYFLLVALSQFIPALKIGQYNAPPITSSLCPSPVADQLLALSYVSVSGFIVTYVAPLAFVLLVTMGKEAYDDYLRFLRDREANSARYLILDYTPFSETSPPTSVPPTKATPSSRLQVGDLVLLEKNQRVPADMILLRTSDASGTAFVRTDQLDGETDWKLRVAVQSFQTLTDDALLTVKAEVYGPSQPSPLCCRDRTRNRELELTLPAPAPLLCSRPTHQGHPHVCRHDHHAVSAVGGGRRPDVWPACAQGGSADG